MNVVDLSGINLSNYHELYDVISVQVSSSFNLLNRFTSIRSKNEGAKNFKNNAAVAENVAATIKSDLPAATESRMVVATSSGSAPSERHVLLSKGGSTMLKKQTTHKQYAYHLPLSYPPCCKLFRPP